TTATTAKRCSKVDPSAVARPRSSSTVRGASRAARGLLTRGIVLECVSHERIWRPDSLRGRDERIEPRRARVRGAGAKPPRGPGLVRAARDRTLPGGKGFAAGLLLYHVPSGADAYDPANAVIFAVGPITDTSV